MATKKPTAKQLAARAKFAAMVRAKAAAKKKAAKKTPAKKIAAKKVAAKKIVNKPQKIYLGNITYQGTIRKGKNTFVQYRKISGYDEQKEIIVGKIGAITLLKEYAPEVKIRITRGKKVTSAKIKSPQDAADILKKFINAGKVQTQEFMAVAYLNNASNVLAVYMHSAGGITSTTADVRLMMAAALKLGATSIILCHNHPSGNLTPSNADKNLTREIVKVANLHNISVSDHIILSKDGYYSFAENNLI